MGAKPVIPRARADEDIQEAIAFYRAEGAGQAALAFVAALERAIRHIGAHPATGSSRYAHELALPGLGCWPMARFPYVVFYVARPDQVDVWRVLQAQRDMTAWLSLCR